MNDPIDPNLKHLLRNSLRPADTRLRRDLWPGMQARLAEQQRPRSAFRFRLRWWEWALAGGDLSAAYFAPDAIPALLLHL